MNTTHKILTPEIIAQVQKAAKEGTFGKAKMAHAKELLQKGILEQMEALLEQKKQEAQNI